VDAGRAGAVVLAAGAARRFGSDKLLADLDGRPVLQHVLDTIAESGIGEVVVVLGAAADSQRSRIAWGAERTVVNPDPSRGLASSLLIGLSALAGSRDIDAALVCLGDQPRLRGHVVALLLDAIGETGRPIVVPRYEHGGGGNPVLLARDAWGLADRAEGDEGLRRVIQERPADVAYVDVPGSNPDVDTPGDLRRVSRGEA
jgi:molybdenum cofactor cytidylyltransferase